MTMKRARLLLSSALLVVLAACDGGGPGSQAAEQRSETVPESEQSSEATQSPLVEEGVSASSVSVPARSLEGSVTGGLEPVSIVPSIGLAGTDPVLWGKLLILGTAGGTVSARSVDADLSWEIRYPAPIDALAVAPTLLLVAAGRVVEALSPVSGALVWRTDLEGSRVTTRMTLTPGSVYFGTSDAEVIAIAKEDGSVRWRVRLDAPVADRIPVADGVAYAATEDGTLHAISATSGEVFWSHRSTDAFAAGPSVGSGRIAVAGIDGTVTVFGVEEILSEWELEAEPVLVAPIWHGGRLLVVDGAGTVFSFDKSGDLLWQYELTADLAGIPVRIGDVLVLGEAGGGLVSIDLRSGTEISTVSFGAQLRGEAVLVADRLWWTLADGSVREVGFDGDQRESPLLTSEGSWVLPETGTFRLADERVSLTMRSGRDAVFEITVTSAPSEDLVLRVVSAGGAEVATNMGKVTLGRTVRAALDAGISYELIISRPNPRGEITVSVQTRQLH